MLRNVIKPSYKIAFIASIISLMIAAAFIFQDNKHLANSMALIVYCLLIITVVLVLAELLLDHWKGSKILKK